MRKGLLKKVLLHILPLLSNWFFRGLFKTCRVHFHGIDFKEKAENSGKPVIATIWHYSVLGIFGIFRDEPYVVMVSASHDGDYLSRLANQLGFSVVRGSRNNKGSRALKALLRELKSGKNGGLVADGSQGPALKAQPGSLLLASRCEGIILPGLWSSKRYFVFNSWDKMILPFPFSRIDFFYGEPLTIPQGLKAQELEPHRITLEYKLNKLYRKAWDYQGKNGHHELFNKIKQY